MIRLYHGSNVAIDDFLLNNLDTELYLRGSLNNYHYLRRELDYGKP